MVQTIKEIKAILSELTELNDPYFEALGLDSRVGVQKALERRRKQILADHTENARLEKMLTFEKELYAHGIDLIAGVDEVGRGPLAGPVIAAAVILPKHCKIKGLNDSKQVPKAKHCEIYEEIQTKAVAIGIGLVDHDVIDEINIYEATKVAMIQALNQLKPQAQHVLIDAMRLEIPLPQTKIIHGDARSESIAAASIVAKVTRDEMMKKYAKQYPGYDFEHNSGYGTAKHLSALKELGVTPIHRRSYEPVKTIVNEVKNGSL
ncbi:ribonuclease HII [Lactococcus fujiensis]|uniref:ribonuclease HII n=1 Tax=Lactococcus fujiensis TaxID=610251 RepID=UPI000BDF115E|nr:ribonuclease HII [Lactococcus fujiensis]